VATTGITQSPVLSMENGAWRAREDHLAVEEPLEIQLGFLRKKWRVHQSVSVTMRTPGQDAELAIGFLFGEGIIRNFSEVEGVTPLEDNIVRVELRSEVAVNLKSLERHFYSTSSCGVCGKASIAGLRMKFRPFLEASDFSVSPQIIHALPETLRQSQDVFDLTGGLHAAALFDSAGVLVRRCEDVGRHNAVDKLIGAQWLAGEAERFSQSLLLVSGRASFELMQKAMMAGIPILAAVGAPSSLAVDLAKDAGLTLLGFVRDHRFNIYTHPERIRS
jgi:FdhD protein